MKHLLKMLDLSTEEILELLNLADQLKYERSHHIAHRHLEGKTLGMIFQKSSTRTRVSFEAGMFQLGGSALFFKRTRSANRPWRASAGYGAGAFPVSRWHHDPHLRAGGSGGARRIWFDPDYQRPDRIFAIPARCLPT